MNFESVLEVLALSVGSIGGVIAAFKAVAEIRLNRIQRVIEHRWKQTGEAKEFIAAIKRSYKSFSALQMLDWSGRSYEIDDGEKATVKFEDVDNGMRINDLQFSKKESFIRDCFDDLYDKFDLIEHFIRHGFIELTDIDTPLRYYAIKIAENENHIEFMKKYNHNLALFFVKRFE